MAGSRLGVRNLALIDQVKRLRAAGIGISRGPTLLGITREQWRYHVRRLRTQELTAQLGTLSTDGQHGIVYRCICGGRSKDPEGHPGCRAAS